jgi:hypothetical protein
LKILISEPKTIISFLFKRSGKKEMTQSEFYLTLSMDLKWFTPKEAKDFTSWSIKKNMLLRTKGILKPNFNINSVIIPIGFSPSKEVLNYQKNDVDNSELNIIDLIVKQISKSCSKDIKDILEKIKEVEKEKNITFIVAALLVSIDYDIVLDDFLESIENKIYT